MRAVLTRTQFLPAVRHVIGWRGLRQSAADAALSADGLVLPGVGRSNSARRASRDTGLPATPILLRRMWRWNSMARGEDFRIAAISLVVLPCFTRTAIWVSWNVSGKLFSIRLRTKGEVLPAAAGRAEGVRRSAPARESAA